MKEKINNVSYLNIGYPIPLIKNGIVLIDSPGTNDISQERLRITNEYIPRSDAAIFLLNASQIFKASERAFLQRILDADIKKVFFVINFKDKINSKEEMEDLERQVRDHLPKDLVSPKIFLVSALHALLHYKSSDGEEVKTVSKRAQRRQQRKLPLEETGMIEFEQQLLEFLMKESGTEKLRRPVDRIQRLLTLIINQIEFEFNSLNNNIENIELKVQDINKELECIERDLNSKANSMIKKLEKDFESIVRWYSNEINTITKIANDKLNEGIYRKENPEIIKDNIELAVASKEKNLTQQLSLKIREAVKTIVLNENQQLNQQLGQLTDKLFQNTRNTEDWEEISIQKENNKIRSTEGEIGSALLGGALLFLTAGTFGWSLLGAGVGYGAYNYAKDKELATNIYTSLKRQVKNRYNDSMNKQIKDLEKELKTMTKNLIENYKKTIQENIDLERKRTNMLIENQNLEAKEVERRIIELEKDKVNCSFIINELRKEFIQYQNYVNKTGVKKV